MGARKQKDRLTDKDRKFCAVLYSDADDYDCEVVLNNLRSNFPRWAYCLHDKDTTDDGELKKPHYHVVMGTGQSPYLIAGVSNKLGVPANYIQFCDGFRGAVRYLIHLDHPDKYQYNATDISANFNPKKHFGDVDGEQMSREVFEYLDNHVGCDWLEIMRWAMVSGNYAVFRRDYRLFQDYYNLIFDGGNVHGLQGNRNPAQKVHEQVR